MDKLEQAEIIMTLEETKNLNLHYVKNIQTITSQVINLHDSDAKISEKITEILNIYKINPSFKSKTIIQKMAQFLSKIRTQHC